MSHNKIIFHDTGEEIDDQIALFKYFNHLRKNSTPSQVVYVVATNGIYTPGTSHGSACLSATRNEILHEYFPELNGKNVIRMGGSTVYIMSLSDLPTIQRETVEMLQIAPLTGVSVEFLRNNTLTRRVVMGEKPPTPSINTNKSWQHSVFHDSIAARINAEYVAQNEILRDVPTVFVSTKLCRKVPITHHLLLSLPSAFQTKILDKTFELLVGRVPPHSDFCEDVTVKGNAPFVERIRVATCLDHRDIPSDVVRLMELQCDSFVRSMKKCVCSGVMRKALLDIYKTVYLITGSLYDNKRKLRCAALTSFYRHLGTAVVMFVVSLVVGVLSVIFVQWNLTGAFILISVLGLLLFTLVKYQLTSEVCDFSLESLQHQEDAKGKFIIYVGTFRCDLTPAYDLVAMCEFIDRRHRGGVVDEDEVDHYIHRIQEMC